ncbi:hypothetical protein [Streptomyces sp. NPDC058486]|uniref:hypothetical protein n=1 Tax=unclassified Streptomyces TaxID=2593676 RepID=UPI003664C6E5
MAVGEIAVRDLADMVLRADGSVPAEQSAAALREVLDGADRGRVVELLAILACRVDDHVPGPAGRAVLLPLRPTLLRLVGDPSPGVRTMAAWLFGALGPGGDPGVTAQVVGALRNGLADDAAPSARASRLRALAALAPGDLPDDLSDDLPAHLSDDPGHADLRHPSALVRLAAAEWVFRQRAASGASAPWPVGFGQVVGRALAEVDEQPWPRPPWAAYRREETEAWARRLAGHPDQLAALAAGVTPPPPAPVSTGAVLVARTWLMTRRDAPERLWETIVDGLRAGGWTADAAGRALHGAGSGAGPQADRLAEWLRNAPPHETAGIRGAVAALAGIGDRRALRWLPERWYLPWPAAVALPVAWAPELLPGAVARLRGNRPDDPDVPPLLRVMAGWGPVAAPAIPELLPRLSGPWAWETAAVLGRIGPPARTAAPALRSLALGVSRPPRRAGGAPEPGMPWAGAPTAAWAYWRVTGDPEPALAVLGSAVRRGAQGPFHLLAELGPTARVHADALRDVLRRSRTAPGSTGPRALTHAAEAWWRLTGDPAEAVPVLLGTLTCDDGLRDPWIARRTVELLGEIGGPAAPALPPLAALLASAWRHCGSVAADEALRDAASAAVARIEGTG